MDKGLEAAYLIAERRLEHRKKQLRKAKADAWDEAMNVALGELPVPPDRLSDNYDEAVVNTIKRCAAAIRALVNPYRSKTDG